MGSEVDFSGERPRGRFLLLRAGPRGGPTDDGVRGEISSCRKVFSGPRGDFFFELGLRGVRCAAFYFFEQDYF